MELRWHRRAHPRRAVARATAILAAHAPLLTQFVALAVQAVSAQLDRAAASELQRSLVSSALPAAGGLEMAARYVPGTGHLGGGWYDVFCLPPGKVSAVIDDVAGAGLQAPVIMGRIRSALRIRAGNDRSRLPARHRAGLSRTSAHVW
jgi:serine phosphatase RsbU (regulator of sigma subunit)